MADELVALGVIGGTHGIRGQVKIKSFTVLPEDIASYGALQDKSGHFYIIRVCGITRDAVIASIEGIHSRNDAEKLRNTELFAERSVLPEPEEDEYYYADLAGLEVVTADNVFYGKIRNIHNFGAGDIVEIGLPDGEKELLPFAKATFSRIDIKNRKVVIVPPEVIV